MQKISVAHLTSVHSRYDTRIFLKECRSLAKGGFRVALIVADGKGDEVTDGVQVLDVGRPRGRIQRATITLRRIRQRALQLDADIYHLHDPELLMIAGGLARNGKSVVFDSHEDVPKHIHVKQYLYPPIRRLLAAAYEKYQARVCRRISGVVAATPLIAEKFMAVNPNSVNVSNFPLSEEFSVSGEIENTDRNLVCYLGGISESRGIREMVRALEMLESDTRLVLCGRFDDERIRDDVSRYPGWNRVDDKGWLSRESLREVLRQSAAGLVTLHPRENYMEAYPIKMFEYMSAQVPVISSNFPLWREIVEGHDCGVCVDPLQPHAIAEAIDYLIENPRRARQMGENGRRAIEGTYNWRAEERKLIHFYERLSGGAAG
jgi:glycosyltransferase involved in cell wall biosynthesis